MCPLRCGVWLCTQHLHINDFEEIMALILRTSPLLLVGFTLFIGAACSSEETKEETSADAAASDSSIDDTACNTIALEVACEALAPAPTARKESAALLLEQAIPLRCGEEEGHLDVAPLLELYGEHRVFAFGETHGTNEIGIFSALLFEELAKRGLVNQLAIELPMDYGLAVEKWVRTGDEPLAQWVFDQVGRYDMWRILPETARRLVEGGTPIRLVPIDVPFDGVEIPRRLLTSIANELSSQRDTLLSQMPTGEQPSVAELDAFFDHVMGTKDAICAELSAARCEQMIAMTHAFWVGGTMTETDSVMSNPLWFERREHVIHYNLKTALAEPGARMYLHAGAFHVDKTPAAGFASEHRLNEGWSSATSRLMHEDEGTRGAVFSISRAYAGGTNWYGDELHEIVADPPLVARALEGAPVPSFVSTRRPSDACVSNPMSGEPDRNTGGNLADGYDGFVYLGTVTPSSRPEDASMDPSMERRTFARRTSATDFQQARTLFERRRALQVLEQSVLR